MHAEAGFEADVDSRPLRVSGFLCLLFGLFTPVAALAAAGFLGSVFLSQLPPTTGPTSTNYQLVESMACLVLASTGAGRFAGLDYFLHLIVRREWGTSAKSSGSNV